MRNTIGWNVVVALALLLGVGAAQAQTVIFDTMTPDPNKAVGIDGLVVDGTTYDVDFTARANPQGVYGDFPGDLDFNDEVSAAAAHAAVDFELNDSVATTVGAPFNSPQDSYVIGYGTKEGGNGQLLHLTSVFDTSWQRIDFGEEFMPWNAVSAAQKAFALFTPVPEPSTTLSVVAALATLGGIARWRREESEGTA